MAKVPTERVTVRLNKLHLGTIDALIETGQYRNRTHAIAEGVRDWVHKQSRDVKLVAESAQNQLDLQALVAQMVAMKAKVDRLSKK